MDINVDGLGLAALVQAAENTHHRHLCEIVADVVPRTKVHEIV